MYYVYLHKRKGTNKVFYVGKGSKNRDGERSEMMKNRNRYWQHIVEKDGGFDVEIYQDNLTEDKAYELEKELIAQIGLETLTNMTEGGEGGDTLSNHPNLDKIGKKISEAHMGKKNPNYGKGYYYWWVQKYGKEKADKMQSEVVERVANKNRGKSHPKRPYATGKNNPSSAPEVREKIRQSRLNQPKVSCQKCGQVVSESRLSLHIDKPICLKNQNNG